jgi:pilus assembly protein FimV
MNRSLKLSMLMALALGTSQALALDLGQIQVKSALGQPLLAEIPLHAANPGELKNLTVQLASSADFARAGISGGRTSIPLQFSVASNGSGQQVIRITSSVAVDDPYLDLLLEVNGGSAGKSVREVTILLDPPGTSAAPVAAAPAAPPVSRHAAHNPATPVAPRQAHAAATAAASPDTGSKGQYGPVEHGQTLSAIARKTAPAGVDVQQMLLALKQANPDAFYRDNINALKSGVVLRIPTQAEAQAMEIAAAVAEVRRENSDWRAGATSKPGVVADAGTRASASSSPSGSSDHSGDRLALVPAKQGASAGAQGGNADAKGDKTSSRAQQDLLRTKESLASLQQQSNDLKGRLKDLTDINNKNEHLLSLKDNEIAELQNKLAAARKAAGTSATSAVAATGETKPATAASSATPNAMVPAHATTVATATASTTAVASSTPVPAGSAALAKPAPAGNAPTGSAPIANTSSVAAASSAALAKPLAKPAVPPAAKPAIRTTPTTVAEEPWYMQTWAWAAGAGAIVLLILLAMLGRRRKPVAAAAGSASSLADRFGSASSAETESVDGEDVDQEELLDQLAEHPDDIGLHLELVTLYYSRRDIDHFEAAAEAMHAHITDPQQDEWQDVVHMGEDLVPGHPLFDHHPELSPHEEAEAHRGFDIDDYAENKDASSAPPMPPLPGTPKKVSEYNFNFDLTSASHGVAATDKNAAAHPDMDTQHEVPPAVTGEVAAEEGHDTPEQLHPFADHGHDPGEFNDDPVDTKLDLARAYLDMGDADGARAMLGEVLKEGSQMQQDVARRLLETLH